MPTGLMDGTRGNASAGGTRRSGSCAAPLLVAVALAVALAGCGGVGGAQRGYGAVPTATATSPTTATPPPFDAANYPATGLITSATTLRTSDYPSNHTPAFTATAQNVATLQRFYAEMLSLKPMPKGTYSCPKDSGIWYQTDFYAQGKLVLQTIIQGGGCGVVVLGAHSARQFEGASHPTFDTRWWEVDDHFLPLWAAAFGTTPNVIWAGPIQSPTPPWAPTPSA